MTEPSEMCIVCGVGFILPSGRCDHCNCERAENPCSKIFTHKWLDANCVESGCQSLVIQSQAAEIARLTAALAEAEAIVTLADAWRDCLLEYRAARTAARADCARLQKIDAEECLLRHLSARREKGGREVSEQALQAGDLVTYDDAIHRVVHVDGSLVTLVNGKLRAVVRAADVKPLSIAVKGEPTWEDNCGRSIAEWCGVNVQLGEAKFEIAILTADLAALRIRCSDLEQQLSRERERALAWKQAADAGESEVARLTAEVTRLTAQPDKE